MPFGFENPCSRGLDFIWISLDSLVRIEPFQWVTWETRREFFLEAFSRWGQCGGINIYILWSYASARPRAVQTRM
jgi:hypothetical protein